MGPPKMRDKASLDNSVFGFCSKGHRMAARRDLEWQHRDPEWRRTVRCHLRSMRRHSRSLGAAIRGTMCTAIRDSLGQNLGPNFQV